MLVSLFFPGLAWGILWYTGNLTIIRDKLYTGFTFLAACLALWPIVLAISLFFSMFLIVIHPSLAFIVMGGLGAFSSYSFFSLFVLEKFVAFHSMLSLLSGMAAYPVMTMFDHSGNAILLFVIIWQLLVGAGFIYFGIQKQVTVDKEINKK